MLGVGRVLETEFGEFSGRRVVTEVELAQPRLEFLATLGDLVELIFHRGRELIVDEIGKIKLEQVHHGEGPKRWHERLAFFPHVAPSVDGLHHRGVGRGTSNA